MKTKLEEIWAKQESESNREVVRVKIEDVKSVGCFIGLIGSTGARIFQLDVPAEIKIHTNYLNKFRGIEIQNVTNPDSKFQKFSIILLEKKFNDIFLLFIEDILERLKYIQDSKESLIVVHQRVTYWKQLFAHVTGELLSPALQRGLYGELCFLKQLLEKTSNPETVLNSWKGVESANQDFALNATAVEIKTSKAGVPNVYISNEHQLNYKEWQNLYLGVISIIESAGQESTLSSIIKEISQILEDKGDLQKKFLEKLNIVGVSEEMVENYNEINYLIRNKFFFRVAENFPLIIPSTLDNESIFNIKYQIDLKSCKPFEIKEEEVISKYYE